MRFRLLFPYLLILKMHSTSTGNGHIKSSEVIIGDKFKLNAKKKIGSGAFGEIYEGENTMTKEKVAIKLEPIDSKSPQLQIEYKLYNSLQGGGKIFILLL